MRSTVRSKEAIFLDLILLAFSGGIVVVAFSGVSADARLVPLIIGVPTVIGLLAQFLFDVFPRLRPGSAETRRGGEAQSTAGSQPGDGGHDGTVSPGINRRSLIFGGWVVGFVLLSAAVGFLISAPLALLFFYKVLAGQSWRRSVTIAALAWLVIYILFGLVLNVAF